MRDECRSITPVEFVTIDPKMKRFGASDIELHAYPATVPRQCFHFCHFDASKCREQRLSYVSDVGLAEFVHVDRRVERTIVRDHPLTVPRDLKAQRSVAIEAEQQPQRLSVHLTSEKVTIRSDRAQPHSLHAAASGSCPQWVETRRLR